MKKITLMITFLMATVIGLSSFTLIKEKNFAVVLLEITVLDDQGNVMEGAEVTLYNTRQDWNADVNGIKAKKLTNKNGKVKFTKGLTNKDYFVRVVKNKFRSSDNLKTQSLQKNRLNKMNVILTERDEVEIPKTEGER